MKKTKLITTSLLTVAALSMVTTSTLAAVAGNTTSKGRVEFTDPEDPDPQPYDPTDPAFPPAEIESNGPGEGAGTKGALRFERVPNFDFVQIPISLETKTVGVMDEAYKLKGTTTPFYGAPTVEVTDGRGDAPGWKASVKTDGVFTPTTGPAIVGEIAFNNSVANSYTSAALQADAPAVSNIVLTNQFQPFAVAQAGKGHAKWGISYYDGPAIGKPVNNGATRGESEAITLKVAGGQKVTKGATYTAVITWQLEDTAL